ISGGAFLKAAHKLRAKLIRIAGHLLEASPDDIVLADGAATVEPPNPRSPGSVASPAGVRATCAATPALAAASSSATISAHTASVAGRSADAAAATSAGTTPLSSTARAAGATEVVAVWRARAWQDCCSDE
ncbi:MAG: hypothetical protein ACLGHP_02525, partial [Vicinamibacteria bacterium]